MEAIMRRLKEIDAAAAAILDNTVIQKQDLQEKMQKKTEEFDRNLQQSTDRQIKTMKEEMDQKIDAEIRQLSAATDAQIQKQQKRYEENKEKMAGEIFEAITGKKWVE